MRQTLYFLIFITALLLAIFSIYIEYRVLIETRYFEEPSYNIAAYGIKLKGGQAAVAHLLNITIAFFSLLIARSALKKFREK